MSKILTIFGIGVFSVTCFAQIGPPSGGSGLPSCTSGQAIFYNSTPAAACSSDLIDTAGSALTIANGVTLTGISNSIGTTPTDIVKLSNSKAAAAGAQQYSPALETVGQGWKTASTAGSQQVSVRTYTVPVQGLEAPYVEQFFDTSSNGSYQTAVVLHSSIVAPSNISTYRTTGILVTPPSWATEAGGAFIGGSFNQNGSNNICFGNVTLTSLQNNSNVVSPGSPGSAICQAGSGSVYVGFTGNPTNIYGSQINLPISGTTNTGVTVKVPSAGLLTVGGAVENTGTLMTLSGCSAGTPVGGATDVYVTLGNTTATPCTITLTPNGTTGLTATNGWVCGGSDLTDAVALAQNNTTESTTTCTVYIPGTASSNAKVSLWARPS